MGMGLGEVDPVKSDPIARDLGCTISLGINLFETI
jgi:hypothetical protein